MSSPAIGASAPLQGDSIAVVAPGADDAVAPKHTGLHSPPDSNNAVKLDGSDDSELSDLDDAIAEELRMDPPLSMPVPEDDIGEIEPDHFDGTVPVFKPTMHQFKDFKKFVRFVLFRARCWPSLLPFPRNRCAVRCSTSADHCLSRSRWRKSISMG
jgi:hypothetical protein